MEIFPRRRGDAAAQNQVLLDLGTSQIEITVLETDIFGDLRRAVEDKRRCLRLIENLQVIGHHLDRAGLQIGILHPLRSPAHHTPDGQDKFARIRPASFMAAGTDFGIENDLNESLHDPGDR